DAVLARVDEERFGVGGPLVQLPTEALAPAATEAMAQLESRLTRQARLRALFTLLPLSAPVDDFYVASGFGKRRDPFTKQWALHEGIDLNAQVGSPVMATAPGTVVEVGWEDGYGRNVLVDHGFGIRTRYAHLEKAVVKQGDTLGHGDQVGTLGNSGRSSGPHLHYEVLVGGRPVDPLRFMEKARHVCEG
ncbi:MAG TPA: M23 family metallopeptidase, partial [Azospirillaceae bacterium]|nr:M23 family metallopeptidase [Azospirillaceae bacterium]